MANDILLHTAMKENQRLMRCYAQVASKETSTTTLANLTYGGSAAGSIYGGASQSSGGPTCQCPSFLCDWNSLLKPLMTGFSNGIRVRNDDGYYRCNQSCTWTVPSNVSRATFAMWSPGSGTSSNCCCGGAPYGITGSFVIYKDVMVCPTEQFSLCAGCGYCCNAYQTDPGQQGCTHICGCCFCIRTDSAHPCYSCWNQDISGSPDEAGGTFGQINSQIPSTDGCGPTRCSGWNFCWDQGQDNVNVPFSYSYAGWCTCCDGNGSTRHGISNYVSVTPYGYRSMYPAICISSSGISNVGDAYTWMAPTICFDQNQGCNPFCWNGNSCFGCNYRGCNGGRQYPGGGGWASSSYSGCNACGGDSGRYGMICVMWNTD